MPAGLPASLCRSALPNIENPRVKKNSLLQYHLKCHVKSAFCLEEGGRLGDGRLGDRRPKTEVGRKERGDWEIGRRKKEDGRQETEDRSRETEDGSRKTEEGCIFGEIWCF